MKIKLVLLILILPFVGFAKTDYVQQFEDILNSKNQINNLNKLREMSNRGNSIDFMSLSYNISAFNNMYIATSNKYYLQINQELLNNIFKSSVIVGGKNTWKASSKLERFSTVDNSEVILYEGYLSKYMGEYLFICKGGNIGNQTFLLDRLESLFMKWYQRSYNESKDASRLFGIRTHIGAQWATTALYLSKLTKSSKNRAIYKSFYETFSASLKKNMKVISKNNASCYVWNSTWDESYTTLQRSRRALKKDKSEIQDVSHANHVVQFIVASYELGLNDWTKGDLDKLVNTYKFNIYRQGKSFSDNVDGTKSIDKSLQGTGWKVSDGWMKLAKFDKNLLESFQTFYNFDKSTLDRSYLNLQFISAFAVAGK